MRRRSAAASLPAAAAAAADAVDAPKLLPLRPIIRGPYDDDDVAVRRGEMSVVYAEPHTEVLLNCDVDLDVVRTLWLKDGQVGCAQHANRNACMRDGQHRSDVKSVRLYCTSVSSVYQCVG